MKPIDSKLIDELTDWVRQQFVDDFENGRQFNVRKIVSHILRAGQRSKQAQVAQAKGKVKKGTKVHPALSPQRNTSGIVGICPLIERHKMLGWVGYYQRNGKQVRKRFRFSEHGQWAFARAKNWRAERIKQKQNKRRRGG